MNKEQKELIAAYRAANLSFANIARRLGVSESTIKSYCYRHTINEAPTPSHIEFCPQCGKPVPQMRFKPRRFCSDVCRIQYWRQHPDQLNRRKNATYYCQQCGKQFPDYAGRGRKYCSHPCYIAARYGGEQHG